MRALHAAFIASLLAGLAVTPRAAKAGGAGAVVLPWPPERVVRRSEAGAAPADFASPPAASEPAAPAQLAVWPLEDPMLLARVTGGRSRAGRAPLSAARARVMLQSLTLPGWGQLTEGRRGAARVFAIIDASIWTSFVAFQVQEHLRTESALRNARLFAGIDLHGRSEEYRRVVGAFPNSDEYNQLVVYRDAANLYYDNPAAYRAYIAAHQIQGAGAWTWADPVSYQRYRDQRQSSQRAGLRANAALACALANRLLSAVHAAGSSGRLEQGGHGTGLRLEPDLAHGPAAVRLELRTHF